MLALARIDAAPLGSAGKCRIRQMLLWNGKGFNHALATKAVEFRVEFGSGGEEPQGGLQIVLKVHFKDVDQPPGAEEEIRQFASVSGLSKVISLGPDKVSPSYSSTTQ